MLSYLPGGNYIHVLQMDGVSLKACTVNISGINLVLRKIKQAQQEPHCNLGIWLHDMVEYNPLLSCISEASEKMLCIGISTKSSQRPYV